MRPPRTALLTDLAILVLVAVPGLHCRSRQVAQFATGDDTLRLVRFSQPWIQAEPAGGTRVVTLPAEYAVRTARGSAAQELLFVVQLPDGSYSDNCYAVSVDGRFQVRPASRREWEVAEPLSKTRSLLPASEPAVLFAGKNFAKPAGAWGLGLVSPNHGWLALFSHTVDSRQKPPRTIFSFLAGGEPAQGELRLAVYDTASGQMKMAGSATYSGLAAGILLDGAFWAGNRYIILPLDSLFQVLFLGIVPG